MSKRRIEVSNRYDTIDSFQFKTADIIILDRNIQISWGLIMRTNKAVEFQVLIGYMGYHSENKYISIRL